MSLINDVLRDLDKRHVKDEDRGGIPNEVRALPRSLPARSRRLPLVVGATTLLLAALALWLMWPANEPVDVVPVAAKAPTAKAIEGNGGAMPTIPAVPPASTVVLVADPIKVAPANVKMEAREPAPSASATKAARVEPQKLQPLVQPAVATPSPAPRPAGPVPATTPAGRLASAHEPGLRLESSLRSSPPQIPAAVPHTVDEWQRAQALIREGRDTDAEQVLRKLLQNQPGNVTVRQALLGMLLTARRFAEAMPVLQEGLQKNPEQSAWAINLARLQAEGNNYAGAWETLARTLPNAKQDADLSAFAGTVLQRLGRHGEALTHYETALRLRPQEARWWVGYAIALESAGRIDDSRNALKRAKATGGLSEEIESYIDGKLK